MAKGALIVLYGTNNIGKSSQARILVDAIKKRGYKSEYIKYPVYDLEPFGRLINGYLRENNPHNLSAREFQLVHTLNKLHFERELQKKVEEGIIVVAEDYAATSIAWGMGAGVDKNFLSEINNVLYKEQMSFLLDGRRFLHSIEKGHAHEENNALINNVRGHHISLGKERGWILINAERSPEEIHQEIFSHVCEYLNTRRALDKESGQKIMSPRCSEDGEGP